MKTTLKSIGFLVLLTIIVVGACKKEENTVTPAPIINLFTDNSTYIPLDDIVFTIQNESQNSIKYASCENGSSFDFEIEKREGGEWVSYGSNICPDFSWIEIPANSFQVDSLSADMLDKGDYRIKMQLIIESNNTLQYSNIFNIK
ncbi:MAG: hypothetical protein GXO89_02545 [Chlorobi bacterium]|nr:hypothetical protein [Chlorobiota bacterium]